MRQIRLDPFSGVAGDMLVAGLIDAGAPVEALRAALAGLPGGLSWRLERCRRQGIAARRFVVEVEASPPHRHLPEVLEILAGLDLRPRARATAEAAFRCLAEAEAEAHGVAPEDVHFHEVGALDALADVAGACALLDALEPERVWTGPVAVGSGRVATEHGPMPVPAPATLRLLRGLPVGGRDLVGERTTPTGAALLRAWEARAGGPPAAVPLAVGHGAGAADPADLPNLLRVVVEEAEGPPEEVRELRVRVDDRSGEEVGAALGAFLAVGALDAWVVPVVGKKGRPAWEVVVLAGEEARPALEEAIFRHLGTLGLRVAPVGRVRRPRRVVEHSGPLGPLPWKERLGQEGPDSRKPEFEALRARAAELGLTPREAAEILAAQDRPEGR